MVVLFQVSIILLTAPYRLGARRLFVPTGSKYIFVQQKSADEPLMIIISPQPTNIPLVLSLCWRLSDMSNNSKVIKKFLFHFIIRQPKYYMHYTRTESRHSSLHDIRAPAYTMVSFPNLQLFCLPALQKGHQTNNKVY